MSSPTGLNFTGSLQFPRLYDILKQKSGCQGSPALGVLEASSPLSSVDRETVRHGTVHRSFGPHDGKSRGRGLVSWCQQMVLRPFGRSVLRTSRGTKVMQITRTNDAKEIAMTTDIKICAPASPTKPPNNLCHVPPQNMSSVDSGIGESSRGHSEPRANHSRDSGRVDLKAIEPIHWVTNVDLKHYTEKAVYSNTWVTLELGKLMLGKWETMLQRSDPLETMFKRFGIPFYKRYLFDKLAVPVTITIAEPEGEPLSVSQSSLILNFIIHLPVGNRMMQWNLDGSVSTEDDPDCGRWTGTVGVNQDFCFGNFSHVPALRQIRSHAKIGTVIETRAILPDKEYGRVLVIVFELQQAATYIKVVRILKEF